MYKEFKEFAVKGNVVDLAIGVIIGGAFGKIVSSLVNDIIMPLIGGLIGKVDFTNFFISLDGINMHITTGKRCRGSYLELWGVFEYCHRIFDNIFFIVSSN